MKIKSIPHLIGFILLSNLAGAIGSIFTISSIPTWYASLAKPFFNPPNWVFGPVWTILYIMMGIAAYLVWEKGFSKKKVKDALKWFGAQLSLNALWSILFFGLQSTAFGLVEIAVLWVAIIATIMKFREVDKRAAYLMAPYFYWVTFAMVLNYSLWTLNR